jgi:hypothetical protein
MTPQIVVVVLGGILILAGLLGGGFELKELKMPRVGGVARVLSLVAGIVLLGLGLKMTPQNTSDATPPHTEAPPPHKDVTPPADVTPPPAKPRMGVLEFQANRQGSDIRYFQTASANDCSDACLQNDECRAMTFVQGTSGGTCWLKNTVPPNTPQQGMISSVKVYP